MSVIHFIFTLCILMYPINQQDSRLISLRQKIAKITQGTAKPVRIMSQYIADVSSVYKLKQENKYLMNNVTSLMQALTRRDIILSHTLEWNSLAKFLNTQEFVRHHQVVDFLFRSREYRDIVMAKVVNIKHETGKVFTIMPNMLVVDKIGLIGKVIASDNAKPVSIVSLELISDARFRVPVKTTISKEHGILAGIGKHDKMELCYLSTSHDVKVGELVVTSGDDTFIPKDVIAGYVSSITANKVFVAPVSDSRRLGYMSIISSK